MPDENDWEERKTAAQLLNEAVAMQAFDKGTAIAHHLPLEVHMQVASGCNLDCYMCYEHLRPPGTRRGRDLQELSPELFEKIVEEVLPYSQRTSFGIGGEPMLAPHFLEYVRRAHALNQKVHVLTNGTRIHTSEVAETLATCLSSLEISIDGATAETYERIRTGASFSRVTSNIELFNRARLARPKEERPRLTLCMTMMRSNVHELPLMVDLAERLQVDGLAAWHVIPVTEEGRADSLFDARELSDRFVTEARERARELGVQVDLPRLFSELASPGRAPGANGDAAVETGESMRRARSIHNREELDAAARGEQARPRLHCHMPTLTVYVFYDGKVYPCCHPHVHGKAPMGNLNEQSFAEIWNGRAFRNLRAGLTSGDVPQLCRGCSIIQSPPPVLQDPFGPQEQNADLVTYYGERDLAPLDGNAAPLTWMHEAERIGFAAHFMDLTHHARTLQTEANDMRRHVGALERALYGGFTGLWRRTTAPLKRAVRRLAPKRAANGHSDD